MTRLPHENRDVVGLEYGPDYPKYKVGPICSAPGCSRLADHPHHIWRRSFVIGDKGWVRLWDGTVVQNLCGLCYRCHDLITENKAAIEWDGKAYFWSGYPVDGFILDPQPKVWNAMSDPVAREDAATVTSYGDHQHGPGSVEKCPTCRRAIKRDTDRAAGEKRPRRSWSITVPVDARENGADILDTLIEEVQKVFGHNETKATRYFSLCQALALVLQHQEMLTDEGA